MKDEHEFTDEQAQEMGDGFSRMMDKVIEDVAKSVAEQPAEGEDVVFYSLSVQVPEEKQGKFKPQQLRDAMERMEKKNNGN